ncbi:uncharacterized protein LOC115455896 [Manduca sexta]|uniref:uncharacterized protein LOC115455896 n=1 Tax=Manduca sexta TaxID=7130 RepID=UPI00188FCCE0|nr:uncharacterized protein LOC115455896 [Manduca sexta]
MPLWTDEMIIQFINEIRRRPELWDVNNMAYKDREAKRNSWSRVGSLFDVTPDEAYSKFRNLRTYARNEQKKNKGKVTWFAYDAISFIFTPNNQNQIDGESTGISTSDPAASDRSIYSRSPLEMVPLAVSYKKAKSKWSSG